jgi:hypothetical protein
MRGVKGYINPIIVQGNSAIWRDVQKRSILFEKGIVYNIYCKY